MAPHSMSARDRWLLPALLSLTSCWASATEIYRCQTDGVTTFVDSPRRCPNGRAQRVGDPPPPQRISEPMPSPRNAINGAGKPAPAPPALLLKAPPEETVTQPSNLPPASNCARLAQDPPRARECLREQRRAEVRELASKRLAAMGRALSEYLHIARQRGDIVAVANKGRSPAWCQEFLDDVIRQRNLSVVDDELVGGPAWSLSGAHPVSAPEILDANFKEWDFSGRKITNGYVTVRRPEGRPLTLRLATACFASETGRTHCANQPYSGIYVYDGTTPTACDVATVERRYWHHWRQSMTPIEIAPARP